MGEGWEDIEKWQKDSEGQGCSRYIHPAEPREIDRGWQRAAFLWEVSRLNKFLEILRKTLNIASKQLKVDDKTMPKVNIWFLAEISFFQITVDLFVYLH